jgi:hypothetical protein
MLLLTFAAPSQAAIAWNHLTDGQDTTNNPATTANISPTANAQVYVAVVFAQTTGTDLSGATVDITGCSITFSAVAGADATFGSRRRMLIFRGSSASPGSGCALTITVTVGGGTWTETMWAVDEATGVNGSDPDDAPVAEGESGAGGTNDALADVGTPDAGDSIYTLFANTGAASNPTLGAEFTQLSIEQGGSDVRAIVTGHDTTATLDETPDASWTGTENFGGIGFIVNTDGGAAGGSTECRNLPLLGVGGSCS